METRANYALIGAFTLAVIASAFLFVFWFSGGNKANGRTTYRIVFTGSVSGLSRGAQVLFNGLRVGDVKSLDLSVEDPRQVEALVDLDARTPVKTDTHAQLEYTGLTGIASIALSGGGVDTPVLTALHPGDLPTINADRSDIQNLLATIQNLSKKTDTILTKADALLGENGGSIKQSIDNVQVFSKVLADNAAGVGNLLQSASSLGKSLQPIGPKIDRLASDMDVLVTSVDPGKVNSIVSNAQDLTKRLAVTAEKLDGLIASAQGLIGSPQSKGALENISEAARSIKKLADNLDIRSRDITVGINRFSGEGLRQYQALAIDGRKTLDQLNRTVQSLSKNPNQLIFGAKPTIPEYPAR